MKPALYPFPKVLAQIPLDDHAIIEASAGTGKTYTLEHLVAKLVLSGARIGEVLVVTFTEKAAGELRARVRTLLENLTRLPPGARPERPVPESECWTIGPPERALLETALREFDSATLSTIHSFCRRVLTENAFANQRLFSESLAPADEVFSEVFREVLRSELARDPAHQEYLRAWLELKGLDDLELLLRKCFRARAPLRPTFDPARMEAAVAAVAALVSSPARRTALLEEITHGGTRKAFAGRVDALAALLASLPSDGFGRWRALQRIRLKQKDGGCGIDYFLDQDDLESEAARTLCDACRTLVAAVVPVEAVVAQRFLPLVASRLQAHKKQVGLYDFDDMLTLVRDTLVGPHGAELLEQLRTRYRYALIDEFQDTDEIQWEVFRTLFVESERNFVYLIGDPKQAIYRFRGADVEAYLQARRTLEARGRTPVPIQENFRSTKALIEGYNKILEHGAEPSFFSGEITYEHPVRCGRPAMRVCGPGGEPVAPIQVFHLDPEGMRSEQVFRALARATARSIGQLLGPEGPLFDGGKGALRSLKANDIFVLTRSASEGRVIGEALREAAVPHAFYKQDGLFQTDEAQAILDLLAAVAENGDPRRRCRAWLSPFFELSLAEAFQAVDLPETDPLVQRLADWRRLADARRFEELFQRILGESGIIRRQILLEPGERQLTNYLHIFEVLLAEASRTRCTLPELVTRLRSWCDGREEPAGVEGAGNLQRLETERASVQILTMHASKGLEAPVTFLLGGFNSGTSGPVYIAHDGPERVALVGKLDELGLPSTLRERVGLEDRWDDERLLYVALTRARGMVFVPFLGTVAQDEAGRKVAEAAPLRGSYGILNRRLAALCGESGELFRWSPATSEGPAVATDPTGATASSLKLSAGLLEPVEAKLDGLFAGLQKTHAGFVVRSFSQLQSEQGSERAAPLGPDELPKGRGTGDFLHAALAELPLEAARKAATPDELFADPGAARVLASAASQYGIVRRAHLDHARRLLFAALAAPIAGPGAPPIPRLAAAPSLARELQFHYPIPEEAAGLLGTSEGRPLEIRRGLVKGFIDLLFEHEGRFYLGDWKSNSLPSYDARALDANVGAHYALQARLYSLALVKMLGVRTEAGYEARFGGLFYIYLRGLEAGEGSGIWFKRPSWDAMRRWEQELVRLDWQTEDAA